MPKVQRCFNTTLQILCLLFISWKSEAIELKLISEQWITPAVPYDAHAPTLTELADGRLMVAWYGGSVQGNATDDEKVLTKIWSATYGDHQWSPPVLIAECGKTQKSWDPVLFALPSKELLLFYRCGDSPRNWVTLLKRSSNLGKTWFSQSVLPAGVTGPIRSKPIYDNGILYSGSSMEQGSHQDQYHSTSVWLDETNDLGKTWKKVGPISFNQSPLGVIQPILLQVDHNQFLMLCRDRGNAIGRKGFIWYSLSGDRGATWTPFAKTNLPNPDSAIDSVKLSDGSFLLVYNHSLTDRSPLNIAHSLDGINWKKCFTLEHKQGEYAFPSIIQSADGLIHIVYSYAESEEGIRKIKHVVLQKIA